MATINQAIIAINPDAKVTVINDSLDRITWHDNTPVISNEDILAKQTELEADYIANEYQRDRANKYPLISDQLDMQYHDKVDGTTTWQDAVQAVKDKYPKP